MRQLIDPAFLIGARGFGYNGKGGFIGMRRADMTGARVCARMGAERGESRKAMLGLVLEVLKIRCGALPALLVLACAAFFAWGGSSFAACSNNSGDGGIADSSCDCSYWETLESRAWLEAQREVSQNQNLIFKPDSVMQYSCFSGQLDVTAGPIAALFSDQAFGVSRGGAMRAALAASVRASLASYIASNFGHSSLGGRGGQSGLCMSMGAVWREAKCYNFMTRAADGFLMFEEHQSTEVRQLPTPCTPDSRWASQLQTAFNNPGWFQQNFVQPSSAAYQAIYNGLLPGGCGSSQSGGYVPTGVTVQGMGRESYSDGFCTNPGCTFDGQQCVQQ